MSKKKSLGSSPIGYSSLGVDSFEFIPTIDLASEEREEEDYSNGHDHQTEPFGPDTYESLFSDTLDSSNKQKQDERIEKKIVSYYLEEDLVTRLKEVADQKKMYYSTLVSNAIYCWLEQNSFQPE